MTTTEFEGTPLVIGQRPTTYGELRKHAQDTHDQTSAATVALAQIVHPDFLPEAIKGLCTVVLYLVDEIERLTPKEGA